MKQERRGRGYWLEQLAEYWESGLTIQEYCELKELPYESTRHWIAALNKEREQSAAPTRTMEFVEVPLEAGEPRDVSGSGVSLHAGGVEISVTRDFDQTTLLHVLTVLRALPCSASAEQ